MIAWQQLRYHPVQSALWNYTGRFAAIVAGRGSGKTEVCRRKMILQLPLKKEWPDPLYFYVLPTFAQAKKVAWYPITRMIPKEWIVKNGINKTELSIETIFGSKLYIVGADKPERMEGVQADMVMVDESSDQKPKLYERTIVPMLTHRNGICYRLGVPKRSGVGRAEFRSFFTKGMKGEDGIASFYWKSSDILTPQQIAEAKSQLDQQDFEEQFEAKWHDIGSSVYYNFREGNVHPELYYDPSQRIYVGCDFNVNPMAWVLGHYVEGKLRVFENLFIRETNTPAMMDFLHNKYYAHTAGWTFCGDASSRSRKTNATRTDYLTIKNDARFGDKKVFFPKRNPHLRDRFAAVNAAFCNAVGDMRLYIADTCTKLINDINSVSYEEGTSEVEDYSGTDIGHLSDALGYLVHHLMPIKLGQTATPAIWSSK